MLCSRLVSLNKSVRSELRPLPLPFTVLATFQSAVSAHCAQSLCRYARLCANVRSRFYSWHSQRYIFSTASWPASSSMNIGRSFYRVRVTGAYDQTASYSCLGLRIYGVPPPLLRTSPLSVTRLANFQVFLYIRSHNGAVVPFRRTGIAASTLTWFIILLSRVQSLLKLPVLA